MQATLNVRLTLYKFFILSFAKSLRAIQLAERPHRKRYKVTDFYDRSVVLRWLQQSPSTELRSGVVAL
ncbi:hypothetical protein MKT69_15635, partial [Leptospira borgpetersenii]|uniref:hypothetical protein n=1 Tax=Leptospira borgpetersenii TaxID=174 RepID=UPI0027DC9C9F